jgi:hypothetical protein
MIWRKSLSKYNKTHPSGLLHNASILIMTKKSQRIYER